MEQFEIRTIYDLDLFGHDISFTNSSLMMIVALVIISGFMIFAMSGPLARAVSHSVHGRDRL